MSETQNDEIERRLPEGYYAENFEIVLRTVRERYRDLLRGAELAFLDGWDALTLDARRLYVRLVSRKGPHFRRDRIEYPEIPELDAALAELDDAGFCDEAGDVPVDELLPLLLRGELADMTRELLDADDRPAAPARKPEFLAALVDRLDEATLSHELRRRIAVVRPLRGDEIVVFRLLFFGNLRQDWTEFVLRDLGVVRFEDYELRTDLRLFPTREAIDDTLALRFCRNEIRALLHAGDVVPALELGRTVLERRDVWHPAARRHSDRICTKLGRTLERIANREVEAASVACETALAFYEAAEATPARERRARVLARLGRLDEALALCREIEAVPRDETEVDFAPRFAAKLHRQLGGPVVRRPRRPTVTMTLERGNGLAVEHLALEALADSGRPGFFSENWLWRSLFGLAFWDVVFTPVAGAFQHPFQYGPLDLQTPEFRKARAPLVAERLAELESSPDPGPRLLAVWDEKRDTANSLVAWSEELRPRLELALERLSGKHLARVFDRLSRDVHRYRRGFPDLFVVKDEEPGFELYEVKGPGDTLRPEQGAWIDYLNANGLPASVLRLVLG